MRVVQADGLLGVPVAQQVALAGYGQYLVGIEHRRLHADVDGAGQGLEGLIAVRAVEYALGEGRRIERLVVRLLVP